MIIPIDATYLYFFVVRKQQRQPLVNNIHVCYDTEGVSTAVHVMSIVQSERKFAMSPTVYIMLPSSLGFPEAFHGYSIDSFSIIVGPTYLITALCSTICIQL